MPEAEDTLSVRWKEKVVFDSTRGAWLSSGVMAACWDWVLVAGVRVGVGGNCLPLVSGGRSELRRAVQAVRSGEEKAVTSSALGLREWWYRENDRGDSWA